MLPPALSRGGSSRTTVSGFGPYAPSRDLDRYVRRVAMRCGKV